MYALIQSFLTLCLPLGQFLDALDPTGPAFPTCQRELTRVCGVREILPKSYTISDPLSYTGVGPVASGAFANVYEGNLGDSKVSIKQARIYSKGDQRGVQKVRCPSPAISVAVPSRGRSYFTKRPSCGSI